MAERRLGDVPGIDDIVPIAATLPYEDVSILEVNGIGEITAGEIGLGDLATSYYSDPFAIRPDSGSDSGDNGSSPPPSQNLQVSGGTGVPSQYVGSTGTGGVGSVETGGTVAAPSAPVDGFDEEQLANAAAIAQVGRELGATDRDIQTALMASLVETQLRNLDYGDRDSVGLFQQRDAWGSFEDRMDPAKSARMFFLGGGAGQEGLLDIPNRESRPMGDLAQDVQVSAFPERYAEREAEAERIMASLRGGGGTTTSGSYEGKDPYDLTEVDGKTVNYLTAAALDAAKAEFGGELSLMQGSYNAGGVAASGGTHDGGGVIDLSVPSGDWAGAMTALRKIGFAAWVRNVPGYGQAGSGAHIHAALIGDKTLSPQAQTQIQSYLNNDDGLAGSRPDDGPREFVNNRFTWGDAQAALDAQVEDDLGDVETGGKIVASAQTFLGVPHKWGGKGYDGVDGTGFVRSVYEQIGVSVPEDPSELAYMADPIDIEKARPGDLVSWGNGQFGILAEGGYVLEANAPGSVVQLSAIPENSNPFAVPYRSLLNTPAQSAAPAPYRPPAITYAAPVAGPAPTTPGVRTGGYNPAAPDAAPHQGMNSGGSKPKPPKPTTTKQPMDELY